MIKYFYKTTQDKKLTELKEYKNNSWIFAESPTQEELKELEEKFSLDPSLLKDALDIHEVPRVESDEGSIYIFTRFVSTKNEEVDTVPLLIIVTRQTLVTITHESFPRIERLMTKRHDYSTSNRVVLLIRLLEQIVETHNDYLNIISKRLNNITKQIEEITNKEIIQFVNLENVLYDLNNTLVRMNALCTNLSSGKFMKLSENEKDLIYDVSLSIQQLVQITQENLRSMVNIREAHSTIATNNLNRVIKLFTSLTVVLTIPTILGTFYGMNVPLPYNDHPLAFFVIFFATLIVSIITLIIFYRKDWL